MINIILVTLEVIICYLLLYLLAKKYNLEGINIYGIVGTFVACIMTLKNISIMGISVPLGFGVTSSLIIGGNMITQKYGKEELKSYLLLIILTAMIGSCFLNLSGLIENSEYNILANKSYNNIFNYNLRIYIALTISLVTSIWIGSKLYYLIKRIQNKLIVSNIFSIIIIEFLENVLFVLIANSIDFEIIDIALCIVFRYIIKTVIGIIGTILGLLAVIILFNITGGDMTLTYNIGIFIRAFAVALIVGILGGLYPAIKASRLAPTEALRYE